MIFRTTGCAEHDHPEFTVVFDAEPPTESVVGWLLDHFEHGVAQGMRFAAGDSVAVGMRSVRLVDRDDGTLGVTERVGGEAWEEHVDQTVRDAWYQAGAASKLGLPEHLHSVNDEDFAAVQPCGRDATTLLLTRPEEPDGYVWAVGCGDDHDHSDWVFTELFRVWLAFPYTAQFLALPPGTDVVVHRDRVSAVGGVVADVAYQDAVLTPDGGMYFGPEPVAEPEPVASARLGVVKMGDGRYSTGFGGRGGHPDIVIRLAEPPVPGLEDALAQWLVDYLQDSIAEGTRFTPGQTIQVGWRTARVVDRGDGTLGLEERSAGGDWAEHVEQVLRDLWFQKEVVASVGLTDRLSFPTEEQSASVAACADTPDVALLLRRSEPDGQSSSGWLMSCARDHEHRDWAPRPLVDLVDARPFAAQFLALPVRSSVTVDPPNLTSTGRIGVAVSADGHELTPLAGSYLAALAE